MFRSMIQLMDEMMNEAKMPEARLLVEEWQIRLLFDMWKKLARKELGTAYKYGYGIEAMLELQEEHFEAHKYFVLRLDAIHKKKTELGLSEFLMPELDKIPDVVFNGI